MRDKVLQDLSLALLLCLLLVRSQLAAAQTPAIVKVQPLALTLAPGESNALAITIDQADQLFGFELHLEFDPAVIQVMDADPERDGVQVELAGLMENGQGFTVANLVDNEAGTLDYAMTLLAPAEPVSGAGALLYLSMLAVAPGSSQLSLSVVLASKDGQDLPVETHDGTLLVAEGRPSVGAVSTIPVSSGSGPAKPELTATGQPVTNQSNTPNATPPAVIGSEADPRQVPRVTASRQSSGDGLTTSAMAGGLEPQAVGDSDLSEGVAVTVPNPTSSNEMKEPALEGVGTRVAEVAEASEIDGKKLAAEPTTEQADSNLLWPILAVGLIVAAVIVIGRRLLVQ